MKKISLIGAGGIGGELASLIALNSFGNIRLIDIDEGIAKGKALDLIQSFSVKNKCVDIKGSSNLSEIKDSDVIIVTAGISRKPGMTRDDLIGTIAKIIEKIGLAIKEFSKNAFVICITNPLDAMVWVLKQTSGLKKNMVVGMAGILDSLRFKYFLSKEWWWGDSFSAKNRVSILFPCCECFGNDGIFSFRSEKVVSLLSLSRR